MKFQDIYQPTIIVRGFSIFAGMYEIEVQAFVSSVVPWDEPIVKAFMDDNDVQEMTITSTNIDFSRTLTKQYKPMEAKP
jgi:hypothetical protein